MKQAVIIACAGWKGAGRGTEFVHLPAPFLPLGDGTTAASRLSAQFRAMGYDVALTAGPLGYKFKAYQPRHEFRTSPQYREKSSIEVAKIIGVNPGGTPWTEALHRYIRELGMLIVQPDPGWTTKHDSFCVALGQIGQSHDRVVLARGDKVYNTAFLHRMLEILPWPCQFSLDVYLSFFLLDRRGISIYLNDAQAHRERSRAKQNWGQEMAKQPDGTEGTGRLARAGITHCGWHTPPWDEIQRDGVWLDVDRPASYAETKRRIAGGSVALETLPCVEVPLRTQAKPTLPVVKDKDPVPEELRDGDVVIEAGAYEGRWVKKVCERHNCTIYAFEPATRAYEVARERLKGCRGVILRNVALGKQNGTAVLCNCNRDGANTVAYNPENEPSETVPVVDVAEVVEPLGEIALAHFNAEGGEVDILERLVETGLIVRFKTILVQWHRYNDEIQARIGALADLLPLTHDFEHGYAWGCWKRKENHVCRA